MVNGYYKHNTPLDFANRMEDIKVDYENLLLKRKKRQDQLDEVNASIEVYEATFPELKKPEAVPDEAAPAVPSVREGMDICPTDGTGE